MKYRVQTLEGQSYLEIMATESGISALDLVQLCWEHQTSKILIYQEALGQDFFQLRTGAAGDVMQKLTNYSLKAAVLAGSDLTSQGRFGEMALEANRSSQHIHFFQDQTKAIEWLTSQ